MQKKAPLAIHIITHPKFKEKELYFKKLYSIFNRNVENYLDRGLNIPIYLYDTPQPIAKEKYEKNFVALFIDDEMVLDDDFDIADMTQDSELTVIPIALSKNAYKKGQFIADYNNIQAYKNNYEVEYILFELAHAIGTLLFGGKSLKVFLSHAKKDGVDIALEFKKYLGNNTNLDDFFDANSIKNSDDWRKALEDGVKDSVLLAFQTDEYSTREWCRREILMAKKFAVPMVVVNHLTSLEKRSFPYMANVPTVTMQSKNDFQKVVFELMLESIRLWYQKGFIEYVMNLFFSNENYRLLPNAPELLSLVQHGDDDVLNFIYPDPPLGSEELNLLQRFNADYRFHTPLTYMINRVKLDGVKVAISVSESENIEQCGMTHLHLTDFIIELSRYLLATGTTLLYGGDVRYDKKFNFAKILGELTETYQHDYRSKVSIKNYLAYSFYEKLDTKLKVELKGVLELIEVEEGITLPLTETLDEVSRNKLVVESLSKMRNSMTQELDIRIVAGAKTKGFMGSYSGVLEEVYLALQAEKPVFVIGAFCGVAEQVIQALKGEHPKVFTVDYHLEDERFSKLSELEKEALDAEYSSMVQELNHWGIARLNNGLSIEENEVLFSSRNIYEIIYLILKGIKIMREGK
jgi:hypothetical protein